MDREILKLTSKQGRELIYGDTDDFEPISDTIIENSRWSIIHKIVVKRKSDGKYFKDTYSRGATEQQDEAPYEYNKPSFTEVFPVTKTITVYK